MITFYDPVLQREVDYPAEAKVDELLHFTTAGKTYTYQVADPDGFYKTLARNLWIGDAVGCWSGFEGRIKAQAEHYACKGEEPPRPVEGHSWLV